MKPASSPLRLPGVRWSLLLYLIAGGLLLDLVLVWVLSGDISLRPLFAAHPGWLLLAVALVHLPWLTNALRVCIWTRFMGRPLKYRTALKVVTGADFAAAATPTAIGGFPAKAALLAAEGFRPGQAVLLSGLGGLEDGIFFALAVPAALAWTGGFDIPVLQEAWSRLGRHLPSALAALGVLVVVLAAATLAVRWAPAAVARRAPRWIHGARDRVKGEVEQTKASLRYLAGGGLPWLAVTLPLTALGWLARYTAVSAVLIGLGFTPDVIRLFALQWICFTFMTAVPTPGASGGAEGSFLLIHRGIIPAGLAGPAVAAWRFFTFYLPSVTAGVIFLVLARRGVTASGRPEAARGSKQTLAMPRPVEVG